MPYINFWALHGNIQRAIDYIVNDEKTTDFCVENTSGCNPHSLGLYWKTVDLYQNHVVKARDTVKGYHTVISFSPDDNVNEEQCFEFAKEYMQKSFGKEYDYIISVHNDKNHMHAHIIMNPISRQTSNTFYPYYKKENQRIRSIVNELAFEKGYSVIENNKGGKSYYEWQQGADSHRDVLRKTIDYLKDKVESIEDMEKYLQAIGFEIESPDMKGDAFTYTINKVLIKRQYDNGDIDVYLPNDHRNHYIRLNKKQYDVLNDGTTLKSTLNVKEDKIEVYDSLLDKQVDMGIEAVISHFEDKTKKTYAIKIPNGKKFLKIRYLDKENNYSYASLKKYIEENRTEQTDPILKNVILGFDEKNKEQNDKNKEMFFENANIKVPFKESSFANMTKYERFLSWKASDLQKSFDRISRMRSINDSKVTRTILETQLDEVKTDYHEVSNALKEVEQIYENMIRQHFQGVLEIKPEELERWVKQYLEPLQKNRTHLKNRYTDITQKINEYDRLFNKQQQKNKKEQNQEK